MEVSVDIEELEQFIISDKFREFLLKESSFEIAAFILQTLFDELDEIKGDNE